MQGGTTFNFVTDGIESALRRRARRPATATSSIAGGAATVNQYLAAGAIDELRLHVAPSCSAWASGCSRAWAPLSLERVGGHGRPTSSPTSPTGVGAASG